MSSRASWESGTGSSSYDDAEEEDSEAYGWEDGADQEDEEESEEEESGDEESEEEESGEEESGEEESGEDDSEEEDESGEEESDEEDESGEEEESEDEDDDDDGYSDAYASERFQDEPVVESSAMVVYQEPENPDYEEEDPRGTAAAAAGYYDDDPSEYTEGYEDASQYSGYTDGYYDDESQYTKGSQFADEEDDEQSRLTTTTTTTTTRRDRRAFCLVVLCCCICLLILIGVLLAVLLFRKDDGVDPTFSPTTMAPTVAPPTPKPTKFRTNPPTWGPIGRVFYFPVIADTYVRNGAFAGQAYGTQPIMLVQNKDDGNDQASILLRFDLTNLPPLDLESDNFVTGIDLEMEHLAPSPTKSIIKIARLAESSPANRINLDAVTWESLGTPDRTIGPTLIVQPQDTKVVVDISALVDLTADGGRRKLREKNALPLAASNETATAAAAGNLLRGSSSSSSGRSLQFVQSDPRAIVLQLTSENLENPDGAFFRTREFENGAMAARIAVYFAQPLPTASPTTSPEPSAPTTASPTFPDGSTAPPVSTPPPVASMAPTITNAPSMCFDQVRPRFLRTFGVQVPLPNGYKIQNLIRTVSQTGTQVTVAVKQVWVQEDIVWMAPFYFDSVTQQLVCIKDRAVPFEAERLYTLTCPPGQEDMLFHMILTDEDIPRGPDLALPEGCPADADDLIARKTAYQWSVRCAIPTCPDPSTPEPTISAQPSQSMAPSAEPTVSPAPSVMPSQGPTGLPSVAPTTAEPTTTIPPTGSPAPSECIQQFLPELLDQFGNKPPLPNNGTRVAVRIVAGNRGNVQLRMSQFWSDNPVTWMIAYYSTSPDEFQCQRKFNVARGAFFDYTLACYNGETYFNVIVNDDSFPSGQPDLILPEGCVTDPSDITGKKAAYQFRVNCDNPGCVQQFEN